MRSSTLAVLAVALLAGGSPRLGESFRLAIDQSVQLEDADLTLTFEDVPHESRCPKDVQCIVAGKAEVVFEASSAGERKTLTFEIPPEGGDAQSFAGFTIEVVELEPEPVAGRRIARSSYVATVRVTESSR